MGAELFSCDSMLIGDTLPNTFPYIQVQNNTASRTRSFYFQDWEDQLFYFSQRGISAEDAISMMISGFCKDVFNQLPMEFWKQTGC